MAISTKYVHRSITGNQSCNFVLKYGTGFLQTQNLSAASDAELMQKVEAILSIAPDFQECTTNELGKPIYALISGMVIALLERI